MTTALRTGDGAAKGRPQADRHWLLFADWCAATERSSLPATPATVAAFLAELPAGPATIFRRLRAIDAAHRADGHPPPGEAHELDEILGRRRSPPRFDAATVDDALKAIPVGGWPTGIVGRRDAAIVALICAAGLTRAQVQALHTGSQRPPLGSPGALHGRGRGPGAGVSIGECPPTALLEAMPRTDTAGTCPACALSRWLRVVAQIEDRGWRAVRAELADYGEVPAGDESAHDCTQPAARPPQTGPPAGGMPLFVAIDRHGAPEIGYPLSRRSITAIIATRLASGDQAYGDAWAGAERCGDAVGLWADGGHEWGVEQRKAAAQRFAEVEATLDEAEAHAEAILARVHAATAPDR